MPPVTFYRYISYSPEVNQIRTQRKVQTTNPSAAGTWFTPIRYDDSYTAQQELALSQTPTHRVGPIPGDQMPDFDIGLRPVAPGKNTPGGGVEARTAHPVWLIDLYDLIGKQSDW